MFESRFFYSLWVANTLSRSNLLAISNHYITPISQDNLKIIHNSSLMIQILKLIFSTTKKVAKKLLY